MGRGEIFLQLDAVFIPRRRLIDGIETIGIEQFAGADAVADYAFQLHLGNGDTVHASANPLQILYQRFGVIVAHGCLDFRGDHKFLFFEGFLEFHVTPPYLWPKPVAGVYFSSSSRATSSLS